MIDFDFDSSFLEQFAERLPDALNEGRKAVIPEMDDLSDKLLEMLSIEGGAVSGKINWDSPLQEILYFNTGGFGHGIPYIRSGELAGGWTKESVEDGFVIRNTTEYASYVLGNLEGEGQSRIHQGRWTPLAEIIQNFLDRYSPTKTYEGARIIDLIINGIKRFFGYVS
jgi:hypothetical protein